MMQGGESFQESGSVRSHSLASVDPDDVTVLGGEDNEAEIRAKNRAFTASQMEVNIIFWRNTVLAFVTGTGIALAVGSHMCLSQWNQFDEAMQQKLPTVFAAALAATYASVAVVVYFFARHVIRLTTQDSASNTRGPSNIGMFSIRPFISTRTTKQSAQDIAKVNASKVTDATLCLDYDITCPGADESRGSHDLMTMTMVKGSAPTCSTTNTSSDQDVKSLQQTLGNLQDFLWNCRREATGTTAAAAAASTNTNIAATQSIRHLASMGTFPSTISSTSIRGHQDKPLAELFTDTTVLFADIEGFTAWSSTREPTQVFVLLETLYHAFDSIAVRRKVFKVETVGDCYMAVTGLPQARNDHAVVMARFAKDILNRMRPICKRLTIRLGPDTCELNIRIGMHSGPVTGGLLRGERSRFQLFGDTVNTASRIESTGQGGMIHVSHATAELLTKAGKGHWVSMRPTKVMAKGLGALQTYWLNSAPVESEALSSCYSSGAESDASGDGPNNRGRAVARLMPSSKSATKKKTTEDVSSSLSNAKLDLLVAWNVDLLHRLLKQIVARRQCLVQAEPARKADANESIYKIRAGTLLDEVKESIELPSFNYSRVAAEEAENLELEPEVYQQLEEYVRSVANMYSKTAPFHGFEHASHVTMSVCKLLSRIVRTPPSSPSANLLEAAHDHTYGITSDPLTQFACVLSALIHDADHPGVPNATLVKEQTTEAKLYKGKSVAESHSIDQCWNLLMEPRFSALRRTIYTTSTGLQRFRSLVVNSVMATDICDPDLKNLRNSRWDRAFNKATDDKGGESEKAANDRKATIVIEHLIQASDVAHTMQHWAIYRKWNERLFQECYLAYMEGRADKDPAEYWYEGEKGFFDYYILPLARKLKDCGVFGVSSSEYLDYAVRNREEWEHHGKEAVAEMVARARSNFWNEAAVNSAA